MDFYKEIIENIPEGILICDSSFKVFNLNKALEDILNINKKDLIGVSCSEFISLSKNTCPICMSNSNSNFIPEQFIHHAEIIDKNQTKIPVRIKHKTLIYESTYYISIISVLSDEACLNQAHLDFVSTVSHELRTPLTSIKGFADTLLMAGDKLDSAQQIRFISIIKSQVDRLTRLVENLLTVSRLESRKDKSIYKAVDFKKFIEPIIQATVPKAEKHVIKTNIYPNLPKVWADSDKLEQIMTNLIDNAIKYSNPGTNVFVEAGYTPDKPDFIQIKVKDQGIGIPKEFLSKIFTKFSRIDSPLTRGVQGTGLGLYITKSLVEGMGGNIYAESDNTGSIFTVRLPVATLEKHASQKFIEKDF